jgi:glycerophosphoryl diester phosphodiesterase
LELGATFIETDLRLTRDSRFVCIHDETLERTTNGRGPVHALTLAELKQLDAGTWYGKEFAGERVPSLEELLEFAAEADVHLYLELKATGTWGAARALAGVLTETRTAGRAVVISFDAAAIEATRERDLMLMTGLLFDKLPAGGTAGIVGEAQRVGARQLLPRGNLVTPELIDEARRADLQIVTWTINEPAHMRRLADAGVQGIITDYPDRLVEVLKAR